MLIQLNNKEKYQYSEEDHLVWQQLFLKQYEQVTKYGCKEYLEGLRILDLNPNRIANIYEVEKKLQDITGWNLVVVDGLISNRQFFELLSNKKFPVSSQIRSADEIDFTELPDIFHDIFGHVPLLTNKSFSECMTKIGLKAKEANYSDAILDYLGQIYWFTMEIGLIMEDSIKIYGGAILTSASEIMNVYNKNALITEFNLDKVNMKVTKITEVQSQYFLFNSFSELFKIIDNIKVN